MDTNATIVEQIKSLAEETETDETLTKMFKTSYVDGYKAAMGKVKSVIALIERLAAKEE